jgi:hypothetical protein
VAATHAGTPAVSEINEQEARNATPERRSARPPAAGLSTPRLARTWKAMTIAVLPSN